jgi:hypothetical protein
MLIRTPSEFRIAREFFLNYTTGSKVSRKLYPNSKNKNVGIVSGCVSKWFKAGYLEEKPIFIEKISKKSGKKYPQKIIGYRLNLNFYFDIVNKKLNVPIDSKVRKIYRSTSIGPKDTKMINSYKKQLSKMVKERKLSDINKEILDYIFSIKLSREIVSKSKDLVDGITRFLERIFFYQTESDSDEKIESYFRKGFFVKNKGKYIKSYKKWETNYYRRAKGNKNAIKEFKLKDRKLELEKLMIEFENVSRKHFDNLKWKIHIISDFSDRDWWNLTCNFPLRKYWFMKSRREINSIKDYDKMDRELAFWQRIFYSDSIPEGW